MALLNYPLTLPGPNPPGHTPKSRAGLRFSGAHPDHLPWAFRIDATGTFISALRLEDLWDELVGLELRLTAQASERAAQVGAGTPSMPSRGAFPRRDSRVLGMALVTQNLVLDFDMSEDPSRIDELPSGGSRADEG